MKLPRAVTHRARSAMPLQAAERAARPAKTTASGTR
jgi:hypothetical protein